jgi:hypothetical protein
MAQDHVQWLALLLVVLEFVFYVTMLSVGL